MSLDWIAALLTVVTMQLIAFRRWEGWALYVLNCFLWGWLMWRARLWGFVALEVLLFGQSVYALWVWRRRGPPPDATW